MKTVKGPQGPAQTPSPYNQAEDFLKTITPFQAFINHDPTPVEIVHIDRYVFVTKNGDGMVTLYYKAELKCLSLPLPISEKLTQVIAK